MNHLRIHPPETWLGWQTRTLVPEGTDDDYELRDGAVRHCRSRLRDAMADDSLDSAGAPGVRQEEVSLQRLLFHLIERYGRHTGHMGVLREAIDGRVGEDPPEVGEETRLRIGPCGHQPCVNRPGICEAKSDWMMLPDDEFAP